MPNQRVRDAAREALDAVFQAQDMSYQPMQAPKLTVSRRTMVFKIFLHMFWQYLQLCCWGNQGQDRSHQLVKAPRALWLSGAVQDLLR